MDSALSEVNQANIDNKGTFKMGSNFLFCSTRYDQPG